MRNTALALFGFVLAICVGCVSSKTPVGRAPTAQQEQELKLASLTGDWIGTAKANPTEKGQMKLEYVGQGKLKVSIIEEGNTKNEEAAVYVVQPGLIIASAKMEDVAEPAYLFALLQFEGADKFTVRLPVNAAFKKAVEAGELKGTVQKADAPTPQPQPQAMQPDAEAAAVTLDSSPDQYDAFFSKHKVDDLFSPADGDGAMIFERKK